MAAHERLMVPLTKSPTIFRTKQRAFPGIGKGIFPEPLLILIWDY